VRVDPRRLTRGMPLATGVLELADELLLLRVDTDRRLTRSLIRPNCRSRSGCCAPSSVLRLDCKLYPSDPNNPATVVKCTSCPCSRSSAASIRTLFDVHNSTCIGSPRQSSATRRSNATTKPGSFSTIDRRPPPGRRTRPTSSRSPESISRIVFSEIPLALATAATPPRPNTRASDAAQIRRARSFNSGANARKRSPINPSSITPPKFYAAQARSFTLFTYEP
jgi:hypothetical protein